MRMREVTCQNGEMSFGGVDFSARSVAGALATPAASFASATGVSAVSCSVQKWCYFVCSCIDACDFGRFAIWAHFAIFGPLTHVQTLKPPALHARARLVWIPLEIMTVRPYTSPAFSIS
jgi:hypothetical protein